MNIDELQTLISKGLQDFYERRVRRLEKLRLKDFLRRKNPYLFKALGTQKASEIVEKLLTAYIGASDAEGVDFVIESGDRVLAVALKSGPNIYNASQKKRQSQEFSALRNRLYKLHKQFDPMLGHAYGRAKTRPTKDLIYRRCSGQAFWAEITGDPDFYLKLVRLMKEEPARHKQKYAPAWDAAINKFTVEFVKDFCFPDGRIDWEKLVRFVSESADGKSAQKG